MKIKAVFERARCPSCGCLLRYNRTRQIYVCTSCEVEITFEELQNPAPAHDVSEGFDRLLASIPPIIIEEQEEPITPLPVIVEEYLTTHSPEPIIYEEHDRGASDSYSIEDVTQMFKTHPRQQAPAHPVSEY